MTVTAEFSTTPLYLQVHDHLVRELAKGTYPIGSQMPNEGELANSYRVSAGTMRKALDQMEAELLVERTQGKGTFVLARKPVSVCPACKRAMNGKGDH